MAGNKSFQQTGETHLQISFNVVCADDGSGNHHSTMFANALQDRYALKKVNNSASLGVGVLGSVSMPIGSTDDSMVKVASETVSAPKFYERYFALVDVFLPQEVKKAAHIPEKPKADLGIPEPKAAPAADKVEAPKETPKEVPKEAPATPAAPVTPAVVPAASEPVVPPAEPAPIAPKETPATAPEATTPTLPAPTEAIPPLPTPAQ